MDNGILSGLLLIILMISAHFHEVPVYTIQGRMLLWKFLFQLLTSMGRPLTRIYSEKIRSIVRGNNRAGISFLPLPLETLGVT